MLAIRGDEELDTLFARCYFRNAGVIPHYSKFLKERQDEELFPSAFERSMVRKARASQAVTSITAYFVDPRTGLHRCARMDPEDDEEDEMEGLSSSPAPLLDALSLETTAQRRQLARAALSEADRALMMAEGLGVWSEEDRAEALAGAGDLWAFPTMSALHYSRLCEIKWAQRSSSRLLPLGPVERICRELLHPNHPSLHFSAEALDAISTYLESHLVRMCDDAAVAAVHAKRCAVFVADFDAALKIRWELPLGE